MSQRHEFQPPSRIRQSARILKLIRGMASGGEEGWMLDTYLGRRGRLVVLSNPLVDGQATFPLMEDVEVMPEPMPDHVARLRQKLHPGFEGLLAEVDIAPNHVGIRVEPHARDFVPFELFSALGRCMLDHYPDMGVVGLYAPARVPEHRFDGWQFTRRNTDG